MHEPNFHPPDLVDAPGMHPPSCESPPRGDDVAALGIPGESLVLVRSEGGSAFHFSVHSRVNTRLLSGGPLAHAGDLDQAVGALIERCTSEDAFRIELTADGHVLTLIDEHGAVIARSAPLGSEALSRAMLRLIAGQARRARVVHLPAA